MKPEKIVQELKKMSNAERLAVIEAASRLVREDLTPRKRRSNKNDPILKIAGTLSSEPLTSAEIDEELYGKAES